VFERRILRRIFGPLNEIWRRSYNHEISLFKCRITGYQKGPSIIGCRAEDQKGDHGKDGRME